jgi:gamma-glutamylaminecyclotransferase
MSETYRVFVYGTLKKGFPNHARWMRQARLVGRFRTRERYRLVLNGDRYSPCLVAGAGQGRRVEGEVYAVEASGLKQLDRLERIDRPDGYRRHHIVVDALEPPKSASCNVFVYLKDPAWVTDPRSDALAVYTPEAVCVYRNRHQGSAHDETPL